MLDLAALLALSAQCAPAVAPATLVSIVDVESRFDPLAIGVNSGPRPIRRARDARDARDAASIARSLIKAGRSVDLGIGQINSANLVWLGLSIEDAFEPCANLKAAAHILVANYRAAAKIDADPQNALRAALSLYNTGDARRGVRNGYVARVEAAARRLLPAIEALAPPPAPSETVPSAASDITDGADRDVFRRGPSPALVFAHPATARSQAALQGDRQ